MQTNQPPPIVYVYTDGSELQKFAVIFNQDFSLLFPDFATATASYFAGLSSDRQRELRKELIELLASHEKMDSLEGAWIASGAQWVPANHNLRGDLQAAIVRLQK